MAKNLKLNIKNTQIAQAVNLSSLKGKIGKKKSEKAEEIPAKTAPAVLADKIEKKSTEEKEAPKIKARSRSAFADGHIPHPEALHPEIYHEETTSPASVEKEASSLEFVEEISLKRGLDKPEPLIIEADTPPVPTPEALRAKLFKDIDEPVSEAPVKTPQRSADLPTPAPAPAPAPSPRQPMPRAFPPRFEQPPQRAPLPPREKLGPTGRHVKDLIPPPRPPQARPTFSGPPSNRGPGGPGGPGQRPDFRGGYRPGGPTGAPGGPRRPMGGIQPAIPPKESDRNPLKHKDRPATASPEAVDDKKKAPGKFREFRDLKPAKRTDASRVFDARDRQGLRAGEEDLGWRSKRKNKGRYVEEEAPVRPTSLKVRIPISIKDLAEKMKLKASQLIGKLFLKGLVVTLNDLLEDDTTIQLLGHDFGCEITIDTSEEERIRITDKSIKEEIKESVVESLITRPPVVAFMGHVDHGKTSLIDAIRSSNRAAGEAGAITQHMGAFRCKTAVGDITILDTPGHEAFSAMRARGADVTDIVVLVVAGDEGIKQQTIEAINHAKTANVTIVVAINKCDKPNFNADNVYRQLAEQELLPEAWGGQTITINCSAVTKEGVKELLEMLALQAEVLELRANTKSRARGTVIESEMHKGMGAVATVLIQNGTLKLGDAIVFGQHYGRVKTMRDEFGGMLSEAGPSTPVAITGLSGLPEAGQEFIAVINEKEAREISEARVQGHKQSTQLVKKRLSIDSMMQNATEQNKKIFTVVLRADVQGSLEALRTAMMKIESKKAEINIIFAGVGEISESDIELAAASKAVIFGFHTQVEGHAEALQKRLGVELRMHDIIYHAVDDVKEMMVALLDKIPQETEKGKAIVKATFKSSQHGIIAGCQVTEGTISRNNIVRVIRGKDTVWRGNINSIKRVKEDVREVQKGVECGILLTNFTDLREGDILEAFEITYLTQEL